MSVRSDSGVCRICGLVDLATRLVPLEGAHVYACKDCAAPPRRRRR